MEDKVLYYVVFDESTEAEGRIFYKNENYPVFEKDENYVILQGENGDFCFSKELMKDVIKEWNLEVVNI